MKSLVSFIVLYASLLIVFSLSVILSHSIPYSWISGNVEASINQTSQEGDYPENLNTYIYRIDNYTDGGVMLKIARNADSENPIESAMLMRVSGDGTGYGRYWHGYQIFLRPLLVVFDIVKIRWLNYAMFFFLIAYSSMLMIKRLSKEIALSWISTLLIINFQVVPHCMQFSCCFYIAMIAMIVIMQFDKLTDRKHNVLCLFFVIGALTSFFDLLTTPTLTLSLPLAIFLLKNDKRQNKVKELISSSLCWGSGYVLLWASKWGAEYMLTGISIFEEVKNQVEYRLDGDMGSGFAYIFKILYSFAMSLAVCFLTLCWLYFNYCKKGSISKNMYLLLVGMIPLAWFVVVHQHSITHFLFTWRSFAATIFCVLVFMSKTICIDRLSNNKR